MMKMNLTLIGLIMTIGFTSCEKDLIEYRQGDIKVCVEQGQEWLHDFPVFLGITKEKPTSNSYMASKICRGNYLSTVYVSHKIATQDWQMAKGNRRKDIATLVSFSWNNVWRWTLSATKDEPIVDGISGATPRKSFDVKLKQ